MSKQHALVTSFAVFLLVMVGAAVYMLIGMSNAKNDWVAQATAIEADLNARYANEITVQRLITSEGLDETILVDNGMTDCTSVDGPTGWTLDCPEDVLATLVPEGAAIPSETPTPPTSEETP